jgi:NADH-ubiquinone oxidoreductase chain 6
MTLWLFSTIITSILIAIPTAAAPLSLGLWIWILALITAIISALSISPWFGFIIFLIYIGGILVIFAYFAAISPNQQLYISQLLLVTIIPFSIWTIIIFLQPFFFTFSFPTTNPSISIIILLNPSPLIILALILFFALVAVTKVSSFNRGPLRPFSYVSTFTKI